MGTYQDYKNGGEKKGGNGFRGGFSGKPAFQKKSWGGDSRDKEMFKTTCSECHKNCEVPFRPTGEKPVYCNDCFGKKRDEEGGGRDSRGGFGGHSSKRDFGGKPSFRSDSRPSFKSAPSNDDTKKQLSDISTKLDKLINAVDRMTESKKEVVALKPAATIPKTPAKKVAASKVAKKKAGKKK